ncbi:MAG: SH3 domain-containing protein [Chloroflexi bacterium]|nr:SH3 domain-containing protein [Chloroflexota bacterium]
MKKAFIILACIQLISLAACNLPNANNQIPPAEQTSIAATGISISVAQTIAAGQSNLPGTTPQVDIPVSSPGPSLTPYPSQTFTPSVPMISVSQDTNCRTGPGTIYPRVTTLNVGETSEVIARDPSASSWYIRNPDNPTGFCWVWGQYATVTGNSGALPVFTPMPTPTFTLTPTPPIDYTVTYLSMISCAGTYAFRFNVKNIGTLLWDSIRIVATDNTTSTTTTHTLDSFRSYSDGCPLEMDQNDLAPGESGFVANASPGHFGYNPAGHSITAVFTLCSQNGLLGTCLSKTINFTP